MRSIVVVTAGLGLLSFTACSEAPQQAPQPPQPPQPTQESHVAHVPPASPHSESPEHSGGGHEAHGHLKSENTHTVKTGSDLRNIAIGDKVPEFEVTIDGKSFKLSELQKNTALTENGTLVLTFWCSFCHSCRHVERRLDRLAKQYQGRVGIIALDASAGETTEVVADFSRKKGLTMPIALDTSGTTADIFGVRVTTTTIVIDSQGVLRYRGQFGDRQHAFAADALKSVLAGEQVRVKKTRQKG